MSNVLLGFRTVSGLESWSIGNRHLPEGISMTLESHKERISPSGCPLTSTWLSWCLHMGTQAPNEMFLKKYFNIQTEKAMLL